MSGKQISIIYFFLISVLSVILLIIGTYHTVTFVVNSLAYKEYPPRFAGYDRCSMPPFKDPAILTKDATTSAEQDKEWQAQCRKDLENERIQHRVDDLKNAITFMLIGGILFGLHFPLALRRSQDK